MITFLVCLALLVTVYFTYGRYLERLDKIASQTGTPSRHLYDGVDYVELLRRRTFLIQLLNIAGTGPTSALCRMPASAPWPSSGLRRAASIRVARLHFLFHF